MSHFCLLKSVRINRAGYNFSKLTSRFLWMWAIPLIFISCTSGDYDMDYTLATDASIQAYFDRFEVEALKYGLAVDLEGMQIYGILSDLDEFTVGNCRYRKREPRRITVDRQHWQRISDLEREYIIFHELGHCYLEREHDDRKDSNGRCLSMMQSGEGDCWMKYNAHTRDTYLKELFTF